MQEANAVRPNRLDVGPSFARFDRGPDVFQGDLSSMLAPHRAAMVANRAEDDAEKPRLQRRASLVVVEPPVNDDEDLLNHVVDRGPLDTEAPDAPPDEPEVPPVDRVERDVAPPEIASFR